MSLGKQLSYVDSAGDESLGSGGLVYPSSASGAVRVSHSLSEDIHRYSALKTCPVTVKAFLKINV